MSLSGYSGYEGRTQKGPNGGQETHLGVFRGAKAYNVLLKYTVVYLVLFLFRILKSYTCEDTQKIL